MHQPYRVTWAHELEQGLGDDERHLLTVVAPADIPAAIAELGERAAAVGRTAAGGSPPHPA